MVAPLITQKPPFAATTRKAISYPYESADMEIYFRQVVNKNPLPEGIDIRLHRESKSDSTLSNIENFLKGLPARSPDPNHIIIISSLFHLPRFIDLTMEQLIKKQISLEHLTFVSAEDPWQPPSLAVSQLDYLKSCLYEFFLQLYGCQEAKGLFQPVSQNIT